MEPNVNLGLVRATPPSSQPGGGHLLPASALGVGDPGAATVKMGGVWASEAWATSPLPLSGTTGSLRAFVAKPARALSFLCPLPASSLPGCWAGHSPPTPIETRPIRGLQDRLLIPGGLRPGPITAGRLTRPWNCPCPLTSESWAQTRLWKGPRIPEQRPRP